MTYPTVAVVTANADAGTDSPATFRTDVLDAIQKLNQMIAHTSAFAATLLDDANAAGARSTLGAAASGANFDIISLAGLTSAVIEVRQIQPITAAIASNAITITPAALSLEFRNPTLTNGAVSFVKGTPAALVIAATDSFGLVTAAGNQRIAILAINNAGTIELAAAALVGGVSLDETGVITTATAATLGTHIKAANVRTGVAYRVIGFVDATFTTATGWGSLATVQGRGGQALAAMSALGYGQTWQAVTRTSGFTYYNTTGRPILFTSSVNSTSSSQITVNGVIAAYCSVSASHAMLSAIIPPGASYMITSASGVGANQAELR